MSETRDGVMTELDRLPTVRPSDNGSRNGDHGTTLPALSPMIVLDLLWTQRKFILRRVFAALVIFNIHPLLRILACVMLVTHLCNRNHGANIKLLKIGVLIETWLSIFRKFSNFRKRAWWGW